MGAPLRQLRLGRTLTDHSRRGFLTVTATTLGAGGAGAWAGQAFAGTQAVDSLPSRSRGEVSIAAFGARELAKPAANTAAFVAAFGAQGAERPHLAPNGGRWGVGRLRIPKDRFSLEPIVFPQSQLGLEIAGEAPFASNLEFSITKGAALSFRTFVNVAMHDLSIRNTSGRTGDSAAIDLDGTGGGGALTLKRLTLEGFGTAIRNNGKVVNGVHSPGNGDKTIVEQCLLGADVGYDQTRNNQAIGWTFLGCYSGCGKTTFRLGGAGETLIVNHVGNVYGSFVELPEASGNPGSGQSNYFGGRTTVMSTKLEYHGTGDRMLVDARASRLLTDSGGSNCELVFRDVSMASGPDWPDPSRHVVIQVGDDQAGSDAIRVRQDGGTIEGVIRIGSAQLGPLNRRWSFRDAVRAPDPSTVQLLGPGSHYLLEWRANENVPLDQYRGGEAFTGAIDSQKAFMWRHVGKALVNTGVAAADHGGRRGGQFTIGGFPRRMTVTGLAVFIDDNRLHSDTRVEWFADKSFSHLIGAAVIGADRRGLVPVVMNDPAKWRVLSSGELYVRITKPAVNDDGTAGALVVFYFPYMGK